MTSPRSIPRATGKVSSSTHWNRADVVVADVTNARGNVVYEIGFAHGQRKPVILIGRSDSLETLPGYLRNYQVLIYEPDDFEELTYLIRKSVERLAKSRKAY